MDGSQIFVPESFVALFLPPGKIKPSAPAAHIAERFELCDDMATMLAEQAGQLEWKLGISEAAVLDRMAQGLAASELGLSDPEQDWVLHRIAEILDWLAHVPLRVHPESGDGSST